MQCEFSHFLFWFLFCRGKCKDHAWVNMKIKGMQKACKMQMHGDEMTYAKCNAWNDKWQMQELYVHYDAMKRCLCDAWYECIYGHEGPENYLFLLAHSGTQCPMCAVKKVIWTFRLPVTKECRNYTSITMPWRDAYAMHDMNAFTDTRARKIISSYLRIQGRSAPCVQLRRWYGPSGFPWQKTRPTYNSCVMTWCKCTKAQ